MECGSREAGSAAFAYTHEFFDVVAAYAKRDQGNYFAGKKGQDRYRTYDRWGDEQSSVATAYNAGEEVLNSSSSTESFLLKTTLRPADGHTFDLVCASVSHRSAVRSINGLPEGK